MKLEQLVAIVSTILSILTFIFGDNIFEKVPFIAPSQTNTTVTILGFVFLFIGFVSLATFLMSKESMIQAMEEFYLYLQVIVLICGTIWDSFTTLIGVENFFQTQIVDVSKYNALVPALISTFVIYFCVLLPSVIIITSNLKLIIRIMFIPLLVLAIFYDLYTSIMGNAHFLLGIENPSIIFTEKFYTNESPTFIILLIITIFTIICPIILSGIFKYSSYLSLRGFNASLGNN